MVAISRLLQLADKVLFLLIETLVQTFFITQDLGNFFLALAIFTVVHILYLARYFNSIVFFGLVSSCKLNLLTYNAFIQSYNPVLQCLLKS
jgi:hypothetical protein